MTTDAPGSARAGPRADATRERLLDAAERLFATHGLAAVSHRRIAEEAGQANNSAVGYHVGDRRDLVAALVRRHGVPMDRRRAELVAAAAGSPELSDHVACLVLPLTEHLAALGVPSWYARFAAHVTTDPTLRGLVLAEATGSAPMRAALEAVHRRARGAPAAVHAARADMTRHVIVHTCAEAERTFAEAPRTPAGDAWARVGREITDAVVGLLSAPVTTTSTTPTTTQSTAPTTAPTTAPIDPRSTP